MDFTFKKKERLSSKLIAEALFENAKFINAYPFRFSYISYDFSDDIPGQVMFIVSKRRLKKAVDRNRAKRLMREAYRKQKHRIYSFNNRKYAMALSFIGKEELTFTNAEKALEKIIQKFQIAEEQTSKNRK